MGRVRASRINEAFDMSHSTCSVLFEIWTAACNDVLRSYFNNSSLLVRYSHERTHFLPWEHLGHAPSSSSGRRRLRAPWPLALYAVVFVCVENGTDLSHVCGCAGCAGTHCRSSKEQALRRIPWHFRLSTERGIQAHSHLTERKNEEAPTPLYHYLKTI